MRESFLTTAKPGRFPGLALSPTPWIPGLWIPTTTPAPSPPGCTRRRRRGEPDHAE
jgi:hypothetical protein